jgi:hypothetical protein
VSYLYALHQSMLIDLQTQFDILPVSISGSLTQSNADQMQKYFLDQPQKKQGHQLKPYVMCVLVTFHESQQLYQK